MGFKWVYRQITRPAIQCMDRQTHQSKVKSKAKEVFLSSNPRRNHNKHSTDMDPGKTVLGSFLPSGRFWHTSRSEHYHLSRNCNQLRQARDLNEKSLCKTCLHSVEVAENRRNDIFNRGDTRPRATARDIERLPAYEGASNTSHMRELFDAAMHRQMAEESLGVTDSSLPPKSTAMARGQSALSSAAPKGGVPAIPIAPVGKPPPPKQPPAKSTMPSQGLMRKSTAAPKRTRRGGQNLGDQKAGERKEVMASNQNNTWLANEALRIAKENVEMNRRGISDFLGQRDAVGEAVESAMEYQHRTFQQL